MLSRSTCRASGSLLRLEALPAITTLVRRLTIVDYDHTDRDTRDEFAKAVKRKKGGINITISLMDQLQDLTIKYDILFSKVTLKAIEKIFPQLIRLCLDELEDPDQLGYRLSIASALGNRLQHLRISKTFFGSRFSAYPRPPTLPHLRVAQVDNNQAIRWLSSSPLVRRLDILGGDSWSTDQFAKSVNVFAENLEDLDCVARGA